MKFVFQLFFTLLSSTFAFSQTLETLKIDTQKMYDATYNMDFETILNYTHPKVFEMASRDQMIEIMGQTFENEVLKVRFVHPNPIFTYSVIQTLAGKTFCRVNYVNTMRMTFEEKLTQKRAEEMVETFKNSGDYSMVLFEKDRNSFFIEVNAILIAISDESTKGTWKFINYSKTQTANSEMIVGKEVMNAMGL